MSNHRNCLIKQRDYWPNQRESQSFARKPVDPLLKFILTHLARQKSGPSLGAGHWPTVADEFKRAGFLEGEAIGTSLLIGWSMFANVGDSANSAVGLSVPNFKKTAPLEPRLQ
ncbi:hypothetical protein [Limnobacter sp.]|uniref:hypothetical protein n=1 Tax=Limnobacter sp. TaxID=2003368 RepID=UPI0025B88BE5|nr:hypothetical protein [Limnobacter sp.]